ncbi:RND superfamily putative drug exporter [Microbacteriaceae bacterium SG_E_30_P1]|uniref:RND superfamily putative drug exporter n=1 Tax=Antiquaquibacter oligotrophicus TaxID=2880260 RepID=A0ABT6KMV0_9MICO|nr:MMPL family transporter [Antiquaquibacter oligotrophicus]MDH6181341.1 RND superfamily putative drug exporter [Antiquaquibacter oligotrophicus]UDF12966.1 MMPL family transporter [Antiquaquibacter oligotrophicus]
MKNAVAAIARRCAERPWLVITAWVVVVATLFGGAWALGPTLEEEVTLEGSDSQLANDLIAETSETTEDESETTPSSRIIVAGAGIAEDVDLVEVLVADLMSASGSDVANPLDDPAASMRTGLIAEDGDAIAFVVDGDPKVEGADWRAAVDDALDPARDAGYTVAAGAPLGSQLDKAGTINSEAIGVAVAIVVLLIALGSALAALIPIATGVIAVAGGVGITWLLSHGFPISESALTLSVMVGLGVGIDYSLFLLSRFRTALRDGTGVVPAVAATAHSAGEAAAVAGLTVAACATGLAISGVAFVAWLGFATAIVVLIAVAATLTLTPAVLAVVGRRTLPRRDRSAVTPLPTNTGVWHRIAPGLTARPWLTGIAALVLLTIISLPAAMLQLGQSSLGNTLPGSNQRTYFDLTAEHWGAGHNGVLVLAGEGGSTDDWSALAEDVGERADVASVNPPSEANGVTTVRVVPEGGPSSASTAELVHELRSEVIPDSGLDAHVGGTVATRIDLSDRIAERLPWLIGAVIVASMAFVAIAFRSVLLPLKAALCNLLSISAAFGVIVWVFQEGNGVEFFGLDGPVPLDPYVPMMLFAVLFGLSMDYEVFLLTAVREHWKKGVGARDAVTRGLAETGGVISAAAIIMIAVFLSFTLHPTPVIKVFGLGLAVAVFLDATIIRLLLVPAIMTLLGRAAWWWPGGRRSAA